MVHGIKYELQYNNRYFLIALTKTRTRLRNMQTQNFSSLWSHFVKYCKGKAQAPSFLYLKILFRKRENWESEMRI
jgi:hypothetical protein